MEAAEGMDPSVVKRMMPPGVVVERETDCEAVKTAFLVEKTGAGSGAERGMPLVVPGDAGKKKAEGAERAEPAMPKEKPSVWAG